MTFQTEGLDQLKLRLQRIGDLSDVANDALKEMAEELRDKARDMAPIDYGDLRAAIQVRRLGAQGAGGRFMKGVSNFEVFINNAAPVRDPAKTKQGVATVGEYAWEIHEHMGWASQPNWWLMPSAESVAAGEAAGVEAGGRFLERATAAMQAKVQTRLATVILKHIQAS